jgi:hypothetical protein
VGHEYFHNWTGNRVTCRDWFQLTLKEGLTVYRDSEFTSDLNSRTVKRIGDIMLTRTSQFGEDAGAMAHPVRPDSYIKMDNFYTVTVYEKVCWRAVDCSWYPTAAQHSKDMSLWRVSQAQHTTHSFRYTAPETL